MVIKIGMIGAGRMAKEHLVHLNNISDVVITSVVDVVEDNARSLASQYDACWYTDADDMFRQGDFDAIYITTPAKFHAESAVTAAKRGIHFFCEKPLAWTLDEGKQIALAAEKAGVIASVGYQLRYISAVDKMRQMLADHSISLLSAQYYWGIPLIPWLRNRDEGGGQIFDQGTHMIDLIRYLAGEPKSIYARYTRNARVNEQFENWDGYAVTMI